jgi:predicted XRE-type DNA-binding protein
MSNYYMDNEKYFKYMQERIDAGNYTRDEVLNLLLIAESLNSEVLNLKRQDDTKLALIEGLLRMRQDGTKFS